MEPGRGIDWSGTALAIGIALSVLTIAGKLWTWPFRFVWRQCGKLTLWGGRRVVLSFLRSHPTEAREYVVELLAAEIGISTTHEKRLAELEAAVVKILADSSADRETMRVAMHEVAEKIELLADEHRKSNRTLHTLLGVVAGPDDVRATLRRELFPDADIDRPREPYDGTERRERRARGDR